MHDDDLISCEACGARVDIESSHASLDGVDFCTPCFDAMRAEIAACPHDNVEPYEDAAPDGRPQSVCLQCGGVFVTVGQA